MSQWIHVINQVSNKIEYAIDNPVIDRDNIVSICFSKIQDDSCNMIENQDKNFITIKMINDELFWIKSNTYTPIFENTICGGSCGDFDLIKQFRGFEAKSTNSNYTTCRWICDKFKFISALDKQTYYNLKHLNSIRVSSKTCMAYTMTGKKQSLNTNK